MADYAVGAAQQVVLDLLGLQADTFDEAKARFAEVGLLVTARRAGRTSVPVVQLLNPGGSSYNGGGDFDTWSASHRLTAEQIEALKPYWFEVR